MTLPPPPLTPSGPPSPATRHSSAYWAVVGITAVGIIALGFVLGFAVGRSTAPDSDSKDAADRPSSSAPTASSNTEAAEEEAEETSLELRPRDFMMKVKVTDKQCFGSAGCSLDYQVEPTYLGEVSDLEGMTVNITFEVTGDESGKQIGTISIDEDGNYSVESRSASTTGDGVKLRARATEVTTY